MEESKRRPNKLWTDKDRCFNQIGELGVEVYHTENLGKAVVIERFNRTLKGRLFKKFTEQGNQKWVNILDEVLEEYNNKAHSSTGASPLEASRKPEIIAIRTTENNLAGKKERIKFKVGDRVRIFWMKNKFEKGYEGYWTEEIFKISKILNTVDKIQS